MCSIVPELTSNFDDINIYDWIPSEKQLKVNIEEELKLVIATQVPTKVQKTLNCLNCCCGFNLVDILLQITFKEVGNLYDSVENMKKNMLKKMEYEIKRQADNHIEKVQNKAEKHMDKVGKNIMKQIEKLGD